MRLPLRWKLALVTAVPLVLIACAVGAMVHRALHLRSTEGFESHSQRLNEAMLCIFGVPIVREGPGDWYFFGPVPTTGWSLVVAVPDRAMPARKERDFQRSIPTIGLGLLAMTGCVWMAARRFTRPIEDLTRAVRSMATGALDQVIVPSVRSGDEVGQLARSVETTLAELRGRLHAMVREQVDIELRARDARGRARSH
jgi:methyl-accepting chemotaxis protein